MDEQTLDNLIDIDNAQSVHLWMEKFSCTEAELLEAVAMVGNDANDVRMQMRRDKPRNSPLKRN